MKSTKYRLAIIEDKPVILDALVDYFSTSMQFCLVLVADTVEHFFANWSEQRIDVLLCNSSLSNSSAVEVIWRVKETSLSTHVAVFTVFDDQEAVFQALCAGASDYILKNAPLPQIEEQVVRILKGESVMSPQVARIILAHFHPDWSGDMARGERLTTREEEIVRLLQQGNSYKQVAERLTISVGTVKFHIRNVYSRLQLSSRGALQEKYRLLD